MNNKPAHRMEFEDSNSCPYCGWESNIKYWRECGDGFYGCRECDYQYNTQLDIHRLGYHKIMNTKTITIKSNSRDCNRCKKPGECIQLSFDNELTGTFVCKLCLIDLAYIGDHVELLYQDVNWQKLISFMNNLEGYFATKRE